MQLYFQNYIKKKQIILQDRQVRRSTQDSAGAESLLDAGQNFGATVGVLEEGAHQLLGLVRGKLMSQRTFALRPPVFNVL